MFTRSAMYGYDYTLTAKAPIYLHTRTCTYKYTEKCIKFIPKENMAQLDIGSTSNMYACVHLCIT